MEQWLAPEDRLDILRKVDHDRPWESLDDRRICLLCERVFTGRQVEIDKQGGKYVIHCPTWNCPASHTDWLVRAAPPHEATSSTQLGQDTFSFRIKEEEAQPEPTGSA